MSTVDWPGRKVLPPLVEGQKLDRATFHERYQAMPPETRAELIGGIVSMPSPVRDVHGDLDNGLSYWLAHYRRFTPGVRSPNNTTVKLGRFGEVQPDSQLRIPEELGGRSRVVDGYIVGAPELLVEVAGSSLALDLGPKKTEYEQANVLEYVVAAIDASGIFWFANREGKFEDLPAGPDGIFRSEVFPGLWLDPVALFAEDLHRLILVLEQGLATPEHAAFMARLAERRPR